MSKDEYVIINKSKLLKRIEELEKDSIHSEWEQDVRTHNGHSAQQREKKNKIDLELNTLKETLSESTPLIPEIEKVFDEGKSIGIISYQPQGHTLDKELYNERKQDYISNLKLNI